MVTLKHELKIVTHDGDFNLNTTYDFKQTAVATVRGFLEGGGYFVADGEDLIFVPWHNVDYARIHSVKEPAPASVTKHKAPSYPLCPVTPKFSLGQLVTSRTLDRAYAVCVIKWHNDFGCVLYELAGLPGREFTEHWLEDAEQK